MSHAQTLAAALQERERERERESCPAINEGQHLVLLSVGQIV